MALGTDFSGYTQIIESPSPGEWITKFISESTFSMCFLVLS